MRVTVFYSQQNGSGVGVASGCRDDDNHIIIDYAREINSLIREDIKELISTIPIGTTIAVAYTGLMLRRELQDLSAHYLVQAGTGNAITILNCEVEDIKTLVEPAKILVMNKEVLITDERLSFDLQNKSPNNKEESLIGLMFGAFLLLLHNKRHLDPPVKHSRNVSSRRKRLTLEEVYSRRKRLTLERVYSRQRY